MTTNNDAVRITIELDPAALRPDMLGLNIDGRVVEFQKRLAKSLGRFLVEGAAAVVPHVGRVTDVSRLERQLFHTLDWARCATRAMAAAVLLDPQAGKRAKFLAEEVMASHPLPFCLEDGPKLDSFAQAIVAEAFAESLRGENPDGGPRHTHITSYHVYDVGAFDVTVQKRDASTPVDRTQELCAKECEAMLADEDDATVRDVAQTLANAIRELKIDAAGRRVVE